jgi:hypothetical protein
MCRNPMCRSVLIRFAGAAVVMTLAAGCPSSGGDGGTRNTPPVEIRGSPPPPGTAQQPPNERPRLLPKKTVTGPTEGPPPHPDVPIGPKEPTEQPVGSSGTLPNPLRDGAERPLRHQPATGSGNGSAQPAPKKPAQQPFDPVKVNGPIFVGWPKPRLALVITGRQDGYLEPCGCAGLDRMKGGMSRRHSLFNYLRHERGWPVVGIDVGGLAKGYGRQAELKFHIMVDGMRTMGYDVIALGKAELQLPAAELVAETAGLEDRPSPFVSANVGLFGFAAQMTSPMRVVAAAGMKLGITGVLGRQFQKEIHNNDVEMADPEAALSRVLPELKQKADYLILLAHATREESIELARKFPDFDLVVTAGGAPEPPARPEPIPGTKALLIEVGQKGMDAIVLGMFDDPARPRYQRVPLDSRFPASPEMHELMRLYQTELKELGFAGLGIRAVPHPQKELSGRFVGSKECETCHEESYRIWKKSKHARAYSTLTGLDPPRNFDPECVSCHVTGWNPTEHYPYQSGYESLEKTPQLVNTGCETCHGPGGAHVAAENGSDLALQEKLRKTVVITKAEAADPRAGKEHCFSCHDLDNSPDFNFETDWPLVEHYENEEPAADGAQPAAGGK